MYVVDIFFHNLPWSCILPFSCHYLINSSYEFSILYNSEGLIKYIEKKQYLGPNSLDLFPYSIGQQKVLENLTNKNFWL